MTARRLALILSLILVLAVATGWALSGTAHVVQVPKPTPVHTVAPGPATMAGCMDYVLPGLIVKYPQVPESTLRSEAATACAKVVNP